MGWLQLVGSIKIYISFAKEPFKIDDILQKRPNILSILLTVATPYHKCEVLRFASARIIRAEEEVWGGFG